MHPYDHARSSVRLHGGTWQDYFPLHAWFDASKSALCFFTHRALHHHLDAFEEVTALFGPAIRNADGGAVPVDILALQHLNEDCGIVPHARDWLIGFERPDWLPDVIPNAEDLALDSSRRFGGEPGDYLPLHQWFLATRLWADDQDHLVFRHHAFGVFEAEARFGPVIARAGGGHMPTRVVAERHVHQVLGRIPPASDFLRRLKGDRWMLQATSPRRLGLDHADSGPSLAVGPVPG